MLNVVSIQGILIPTAMTRSCEIFQNELLNPPRAPNMHRKIGECQNIIFLNLELSHKTVLPARTTIFIFFIELSFTFIW